jgi:hypothetical protein
MQNVTNMHQEAMKFADLAELARRSGDSSAFKSFSNQALELEAKAAWAMSSQTDLEPTRSVLFRSAATLAIEVRRLREAEQLIAAALAGNPPSEIAEELRDLLEDVYFQRHLEVKGVTLNPGDVQMTLEGAAVGFGIARSDIFVQRLKDLETLLYRTAERLMGQEFRESGRRKKSLSESFELYLSVPRAASFAVTLRLGQSSQLNLPGVDCTTNTMKVLLDDLALVNEGNLDALKNSIPDESYRINFMGLAERLAPDGKEIRTVGFTTAPDQVKRVVALVATKKQLRERIRKIPKNFATDTDEKEVVITGHLLEADATNRKEGIIEVVDAGSTAHKIIVPRGMMRDIVKPMFEEEVVVIGVSRQGRIELVTIDLADTDTGKE